MGRVRAIVATEGALRVRSRRGWNMTALLPELAGLPVKATLDCELVAFGPDGAPDFALGLPYTESAINNRCQRMFV